MSRLVLRLGVVLLLVGPLLSAQTLRGFWSAWNAAATGLACRYLPGVGLQSTLSWSPFLTTIPGFTGTVITPPFVAKHMQGLVYVANTSTLDAFTLTGSQFSVPLPYSFSATPGTAVVAPLGQLAVRPDGDLWVLTGTFPPTLTRLTPTGSVVQSVIITSAVNANGLPVFVGRFLDVDGTGAAWVGDPAGVFYRVSATGGVTGPVSLPVSSLTATDVDSQGRLWALEVSPVPGVAPTLYRMDPGGGVSLAVAVPNARGFDVDACDRLHLLVVSGGQTTIEIREPAAGAPVALVPVGGPLPSQSGALSGQTTDFVIDVDGSWWLTFQGLRDHVAPSGAVLGNYLGCSTGGAASEQNEAGDATGLHLATIIDPLGDADFDGVANRREVVLGADPFDPAVTPATLAVVSPPSPGGALVLAASIPGEAGFPYLFGAAGGTAGLPLPGVPCREVPLSPDALLFAWVDLVATTGLPVGAVGNLDATGGATLTVPLPALPLGGAPLSLALVTAEPSASGIATVTDAVSFLLP